MMRSKMFRLKINAWSVGVRIIGLIVCLGSFVSTLAQTVSEVERKYGKPVYSVSEHIWMTPDYSPDGQVCRMQLYPKRGGGKTDYPGSQVLFPQLTAVLNEIVPPDQRGAKKNGFGHSYSGGGAVWTTYDYENVSIIFVSSYTLDPRILEKADAYVLRERDPLDSPPQKKTPPSLDDFAGSQNLHIEGVKITWNHRPCATK